MLHRTCAALFAASMLAVSLFPTTAEASLGSETLDLGTVLLGSSKCVSASWANMSPGNTLICDSSGCRTQWPEVVRSVSLSKTLAWTTLTPTQATNVPILGSVALSFCATPQTSGDFSGEIVATVSPAYYGGATSDRRTVHIKAVPAAVVGEPLNGSLSFGSLYVGQSASKSFLVSNYTASNVTITAASSSNSQFSVSGGNGVGYVIAPNGGQASVGVRFAPSSTGSKSATIQVATTGGTVTYQTTGSGAQPSISTSVSGGGAITPGTTVPYGSSIDIVMTPSAGHTLSTLSDNGMNVTASAHPNQANQTFVYRLSAVVKDHSIDATFKVGDFPTPESLGQVPALPPLGSLGLASGLIGYVYWRNGRRGRKDKQ